MSDAIVDIVQTGSVQCTERSRVKGSQYLQYRQCSLSMAEFYCGYTKYFRWSIVLILSTTRYFREVDNAYTKKYAVVSGIDIACIKQYTVFSGGRYCLY